MKGKDEMGTTSFNMIIDPNGYTSASSLRADEIFTVAHWRAGFHRVKALFSGKWRMPTLASRLAGKGVHGQHTRGLCPVEIQRIVGTESRSTDFDNQFNPLSAHTHDRWIRIASAKLDDTELPAIELLQVGEEYFVRDGHHRVSVAHALGYQFIDAWVTVLEV